MKQVFIFATFIIFMVISSPLYANPGKVKMDTCTGCHGIPSYTNVYPTYKVPKLAGQYKEYLIAALAAYRSGDRSHPTMRVQASSLSDKDIMDIATYLSGLESAPANPQVKLPQSIANMVMTCAACHANDGSSIAPSFPKIGGQREDYLYHALQQYKSNERKNPIMSGIVSGLSDEDMKQLAHYFSYQPGLGTIRLTNFSK